MGRVSSQPEATIKHFSHAHPLQLSNFHPQQNLNQATCSGCKLKASGLMYSCITCGYFLHMKCSEMPKQITHPFDKNHVFSLLSKPTYPDGTFNCDACGKQGDGFSYHCKECNLDLHILCAVIPLSRTHHSHHHELNLTFTPPYANKIFYCDLCKNIGSDHWLYRCHLCQHDVHLDCVNSPVPTQVNMQQNNSPIGAAPVQTSTPQVWMPQATTASRAAPQPQGPQPFGPQYMAARPPLPNFMPVMNPMNQGIQGPFTPVGATQNYDMMVQQALQRILANSAQPRFGQQDIFQAILSGGGNGMGNSGMPNLLQALTGGNNIGGGLDVLGIGGGGGGGVDILQGLLGGGGIGIPGLDGLGGLDGLLGGLGGLGFF